MKKNSLLGSETDRSVNKLIAKTEKAARDANKKFGNRTESKGSSYNGNKLLKGVDVYQKFTPYQLTELDKCRNSCEYFMSNYMKIVTIDDGLTDFKPYAFQNNIVQTVQDNNHVIIKQPRQSGKTTIVSAIILWHVLFTKRYTVAICANKAKNAMSVLARIKLAYMYLPKWMQQGIITWNKGDIELENGSKVFTYATSEDACRGETINMLYLDEFAFVPKNIQADFWTSVYPTISSGTSSKILITSTPHGLDMFYKLFCGALDGTNTYKPIEVHWSEVPGRDHAWMVETIKNTSQEIFDVEFGCEFFGSTKTLIAASCLKILASVEPSVVRDNLKIFKRPIDNHEYVMTVDTSRGGGEDYSAFAVIDVTANPFEVVAVFRDNKIPTLQFPTPIMACANEYNECEVLIETNDLGEQVAQILHYDLEYDYVMRSSGAKGGRHGVVICGPNKEGAKLGVKTTKTTKAKGCANLKTIVEAEQLIINDLDIIFELTTFIRFRASWAADTGYNDDLVSCLFIFAWYADQEAFREKSGDSLRKRVFKSDDQIAQDSVVAPPEMLDGHNRAETFETVLKTKLKAKGNNGEDQWEIEVTTWSVVEDQWSDDDNLFF